MEPILKCKDLYQEFGSKPHRQTVLSGINISFQQGESVVLLGPSGSGKTTLLTILGCLRSPSSGALHIDGRQIDHADKGLLVQLRSELMGFVFQHSRLLPFLTVAENLNVVGRNVGMSRARRSQRIDFLLAALEINHLRNKLPACASGGEQQRVAIARALLHKPPILLADEPTAALDWQSGVLAMDLLSEQAQQDGALLITVTHDTRLLDRFDRVLTIEDGRIRDSQGMASHASV